MTPILGAWPGVAHEAPPPTGTPRASDLLLDGLATRFTDGYAAGGPILTRALGALRCDGGDHEGELRWIWLACRVAADLWDDETWDTLATRQVELVRDVGAMTVLPLALSQRIGAHTFGGELGTADAIICATGYRRALEPLVGHPRCPRHSRVASRRGAEARGSRPALRWLYKPPGCARLHVHAGEAVRQRDRPRGEVPPLRGLGTQRAGSGSKGI